MHLVNLQMLQCIICRYEQATNNVLTQRSTLCKGLIRYNKVNGITPMIMHVQISHSKLFTLKKQFSAMTKPITIHDWQPGKKRIGPFSCAIIDFFGAINLYKKFDEQRQHLKKDWLFILRRVTSSILIVKTFGFEG
jgi:hypothetical protein